MMRIVGHRFLRGANLYRDAPVAYLVVRPRQGVDLAKLKADLAALDDGLAGSATDLGYLVGETACALQRLIGMASDWCQAWLDEDDDWVIVHTYEDEHVADAAGEAAVSLLKDLAAGEEVHFDAVLQALREVREAHRLGPSTQALVDEARRRGIPVLRRESSHVQLGHGAAQQHIQATMTGRTSGLGLEIADDKERTKEVLEEWGIPLPPGASYRTFRGVLEEVDDLGYPVAVKPEVGSQGRGVTVDVRGEEELEAAYDAAKARYPRVLVERHVEGVEHRLLVVGGRLVAAVRRDPPALMGDGQRSVARLIAAFNDDPRRGFGTENELTEVAIDQQTLRLLEKQGLAVDSVPEAGKRVVLKSTASPASGGTAVDVTDRVHPSVKAVAERATRLAGLDVCGVDIVAPHIEAPLEETGGALIELNGAPDLRMHLHPTEGQPRDVARPILDLLFPASQDGRIPIVAVTGTNGKTTTVRLIDHLVKYSGGRPGLSCTGSVEVANQVILRGDYSGPGGAQAVLKEPGVTHAILEVARGGILRRGLGFESCDVGVFLNVGVDHLGQGGIESVDDLARLKGVVIESVKPSGTAVLNADDERVLATRSRCKGKVILFSMDPAHPALAEHLAADPENVVVTHEAGTIVLKRGTTAAFRVVDAAAVPITLAGRALFNIQNAMAAVAATYAIGMTEEDTRAGLVTFNPTVTQLPGRMNLMEVGDVKVLLDYGHNVPALQALAQVLPGLTRGRCLNVANASGNRRDEDLQGFGAQIATMYDRILLSDADPRGRPAGETPDVIRKGILSTGYDEAAVTIMDSEMDAIDTALDEAQAGDLIVFQVDDVQGAIEKVRGLQRRLLEV
ncbi:MAG: cyanophycin synthetase [Thermoplasmatota archaeon]